MSKSPFRKIRSISDADLAASLVNHTQVLNGCLNWIRSHNRWQWVWRVWAVIISVGVLIPGLLDTLLQKGLSWLAGTF